MDAFTRFTNQTQGRDRLFRLVWCSGLRPFPDPQAGPFSPHPGERGVASGRKPEGGCRPPEGVRFEPLTANSVGSGPRDRARPEPAARVRAGDEPSSPKLLNVLPRTLFLKGTLGWHLWLGNHSLGLWFLVERQKLQ